MRAGSPARLNPPPHSSLIPPPLLTKLLFQLPFFAEDHDLRGDEAQRGEQDAAGGAERQGGAQKMNTLPAPQIKETLQSGLRVQRYGPVVRSVLCGVSRITRMRCS